MKKLINILVIMTLSVGLMSMKLSEWTLDKNLIFSKGGETWVKIRKANKELGELDHPHTITLEQMYAYLGTLKYFRPDALSLTGKKGQEWDLLSEEEKEILTPHLVEAFARLSPNQWIDFSVMTFRGGDLTGTFRKTGGTMFVKDGMLNVALRNIAVKFDFDKQMNQHDPTKGYRGTTDMVIGPAQKIPMHPKKGTEWKDGNWIAIDLSQPITAGQSFSEGGMLDTLTAPSRTQAPERPSWTQPASKPAPVAAPAVIVPASQPQQVVAPAPQPQQDVKQRLLLLKELYEQGLINQEEYDKKRKEIVEGL